eukprot:TRINITY_DN877_c0_g1_i1.p1 TRINITY_DN877_c0_g1~~TRINITY_DN877_c0_g1_i1.p1  ORF type:complete len:398 (+),score=135.17 TRINITY_DN877_c0_g1_i1:30-1196(+)
MKNLKKNKDLLSITSKSSSFTNIYFDQKRNIYLKHGSGGRSSVSGIIATVFGGTGFVGRYVISQLGRIGSNVIVPYRGSEYTVKHLKLMGDLGQIVPVQYDIRDYDSIESTIKQSNVVINLIGKDYSTRNFSFDDVNAKISRLIAKIAKKNNVERFIHVSALAANHDSPSEFARSKAKGEDGVRELFPEATIIRPADIFGVEDNLTNWQAWQIRNFKYLPIYKPNRTIQPIYVVDVAKAILETLRSSKTEGKTYDLAGPKQYTMQQFCNTVANLLIESPRTFEMDPLTRTIYSQFSNYLVRRPYFHSEAVPLRAIDVLPNASYLGRESGPPTDLFKENLTSLEEVALIWLKRYRRPQHLNLVEENDFDVNPNDGLLLPKLYPNSLSQN